ncbi:hypothetical protein BLX42_00705 [Pseudomonas sp. SG-MS2]|uniref:hypothetical protein n=1 Tax=Pseudomonas sp. SG-MS2 TaxID=1914534 RepID=UPI00137A9A4E|nr:hypothetical protein [Pseudomonas sp. SG-MS2]KAF1312967.1 hypothetical protein BLX42_00705 [Pseudomonas sp. SG-MS2]
MQSTPPTSTGNLLGTYGYGKALIISMIILGSIFLALAAFVGYLSLASNLQFNGPRGIFHFTIVLLGVLGLSMFALALWQKTLRKARYEVYEKGICQVIGNERDYVPFSEMNDLYLFASGQTAFAGLTNNLAYRRNASEPLRRVNPHLKGLFAFIEQVREHYLNERLPAVLATLHNGGAVQFNYLDTSQVWGKRLRGDFLNVTTKPLTVTRDALEIDGRKVSLNSLGNVDLNQWTELVVIKDESGQTLLSTVGNGIMSFDLFLNTLHNLLEAPQAQPLQTQDIV